MFSSSTNDTAYFSDGILGFDEIFAFFLKGTAEHHTFMLQDAVEVNLRSVGQSVLVSGAQLEPMTRFLFSV
jgi:hypothetical protein